MAIITSFCRFYPLGAEPLGSLVMNSDGTLFGLYTVPDSLPSERTGVIFRLEQDGTGFTEIGEVPNPTGGPAVGAADKLFGVVNEAVFRVDANGSNFVWLHTFSGTAIGQPQVVGTLLAASDGFLYGRSFPGGSNNIGFIFRLPPDGGEAAIIYTQSGDSLESGTALAAHQGRLLEGSDGRLYGSLAENGFGLEGFIFRVNKDGSDWMKLRDVPNLGDRLTVGVVQGADSELYGTQAGNEIFRLALDGSSFAVIHTLTEPPSVQPWLVALARGRDFRLYGLSDYDGLNGGGSLFTLGFDGNGLVRFALRATDGNQHALPGHLWQRCTSSFLSGNGALNEAVDVS